MIGLLVALLIFAGGVVVVLSGAGTSDNRSTQSSLVSQKNTIPRHGPRTYSPGVPAISPRTNGTPAFTVADVKQFIKIHGFVGGHTVPGVRLTVTKILFIASQQASALMQGESTDRPPGTLVCYVQLHGPFVFSNASVPPRMPIPVYQTGVMVFDAHTGNLLVWGS